MFPQAVQALFLWVDRYLWEDLKESSLAPLIPTMEGVSLLIDCGANVDARPSHLVQFAKMGSIYMEQVVGMKNPRVAIVNNGQRKKKAMLL